MQNQNLRDFNILGLKVVTANNKKDISLVSGYNSYAQKIEQVLKTQKGELPSDISIGTNYYDFIFNPLSYKALLESEMAAFVQYAIPTIFDVRAKISYYDSLKILVDVFYKTSTDLKQQTSTCTIEVPLQ